MKRTLAGRMAWMGMVLMNAAVAAAQVPAPSPPTPSKPDEPPVIMTLIVIAVIAGLVLFASLMPAKRGHQD
jgi:hypothetical protein